MNSNLTKYREELDKLIKKGELLYYSLLLDVDLVDEETKKKLKELKLPLFKQEYERWYSVSMQVIKQILPDRLDDFVKQYKNEKRKQTDYLTYTISDYMIGLKVTRSFETVVDHKAAAPKFERQLSILKSAEERFENSLFDIRQVLQADIFDDELESARELLKRGFIRGAGAIAGVVLEKHLSQICQNHKIKIRKKDPSINDYNQALKDNDAIDVPTWRFIQHLGDIRNLCDHKKDRDPKSEEVSDLIEGIAKINKTVF